MRLLLSIGIYWSTDQGEHNTVDTESNAIKDKTMIVMVTNIGGELGDGHFHLLIPGGRLGAFDGYSNSGGNALNVNKDTLRANNGVLITSCNAVPGCVCDKCSSVFSGHPELEAGCIWSAEWFKAADNRKFRYQEISCRPELDGFQ